MSADNYYITKKVEEFYPDGTTAYVVAEYDLSSSRMRWLYFASRDLEKAISFMDALAKTEPPEYGCSVEA